MTTTSIIVASGNGRVISNNDGEFLISDSTSNEGVKFITLPKYFGSHDETGGTTIGTTATVIPWGTDDRKDSIYTHSTTVNSDEITISQTGLFIFSYDISLNMITGSTRATMETKLQVDTGAGYTDVSGSKAYCYCRNSGAGEGTASLSNLFVNVTSGDKFRVVGIMLSSTNTVDTIANGSRIFIKSIED